jgi:hypothetical protein
MAEDTKTVIVEYRSDVSSINKANTDVVGATKDVGKEVEQVAQKTEKGTLTARTFFHEMHAGAISATGSMRGFGAALSATGIGIFIVAAGVLFEILKKFEVFTDIWHGITDAIGLTSIAADNLAESEKIAREAAIAGLNNEIILLKAKGATMDEIHQKELDVARAEFESIKAEMLADLASKKKFDLAKEGGELDLKLQAAKTKYHALEATWTKEEYETGAKYMEETRLLKEKGLKKDLDEIEIWYNEAIKKTPSADLYALFLLYQTKQEVARKKAQDKEDADLKKHMNEQAKIREQDIKKQEEVDTEFHTWLEKEKKKFDDATKKEEQKVLKVVEDQHKADQIALKSQEDQHLITHQQYLDKLLAMDVAEATAEGKTHIAIDAQYAADKVALDKETSDNDMQTTADAFDMFAETAGKQSAIGKELAMGSAVINTYLGATKALASAAPPVNFIMMAAVIAAGIAQVVKIASTDTTIHAATGGMIEGPSHQSGGVPTIMEGGEYVINKNAMRVPNVAAQAAALNSGQSTGMDPKIFASALADELRNAPMRAQVVEQDITLKQKKVAKRQAQFEYNFSK